MPSLTKWRSIYVSRFGSPEKMPPTPTSCDALITMTMQLLNFTLHDKSVILTRRLLLKEQIRDERARRLATLHFLNGTKEMYTKIFY